jgi:hypothetical protein
MSQLICIDANFPAEWLEIYKKSDVQIPVVDTIYTVREIITHTTGKIGVLLNEIVNPPIEINHPVLGKSYREVTWNLERFRTLMGHPPKKEEIQEFIKEILHS